MAVRATRRARAPRGLTAAPGGAVPGRWLPTNLPAPVPSQSPRPGWQDKDRWLQKSTEQHAPVQGCSELVKTLRRALRPAPGARPTPQSYWRRAAQKGGTLSEYLSPEEACQLLSTLADARLQWEGDAPSTRGLAKFAQNAARELGSYSPAQVSALAWAMARLSHQEEELLQAISRGVERTVRAERGSLSNEAACQLLAAYRKMGVLDEVVMRNLSRLLCRRLIREPLTASQTAAVAAAFSDLRSRDVGLFNATTVALCRPNAVEGLTWGDLASVALAYASLRLHSATLFGRIRRRLCASAGVDEDEDESRADEQQPVYAAAQAADALAQVDPGAVWDQLAAPGPPAPPVQLPQAAVAQLLEAHVRLGRLSARDLAPLLPHLAHPADARPSPALAGLLLVALGRGGHAWPWLWRRAAFAFGADRQLKPDTLLLHLDALAAHLALLAPTFRAAAPGRRAGAARAAEVGVHEQDEAEDEEEEELEEVPAALRAEVVGLASPKVSHYRALAGGLVQFWGQLARQGRAFSDAELRSACPAVAALARAQEPLAAEIKEDALRRAAARAARALGAELARRRAANSQELQLLLEPCGVEANEVWRAAQSMRRDMIGTAAA